MAGEETIILASYRSLGDGPNFSDTVFGFLDENYPFSGNSSDDTFEERDLGDDEVEDDTCVNSKDKKTFWDEQEKLLHGILCRTSSIESRVRNATKEGLKGLLGTVNCDCRRDVSDGCQDCLRQGISEYLCNAGFNCVVQKSKWKTCHEIPSGEHTYLEVIEKSSSPNKGEVRVVIELNFRAEFEMIKATQEYDKLIKKLPQVYVGKHDRLKNIVKILCGAAKKCMNDKKMYLAPWRKHRYMQAKWLNACNEFFLSKTTTATSATTTTKFSDGRLVRPRASMLTQSLIGRLSSSICQPVEVI